MLFQSNRNGPGKALETKVTVAEENIFRAYNKHVQAGRLAAEAYCHALQLAKMNSSITLAELSEAGDKYIQDRSVGQINGGEIFLLKRDYESGRAYS